MRLLSRIRNPASEEPAEEEDVPRPRQRLVGEILRDRREELGLDLDSIGEALRIRPSYLAALEQGHSDELPGPAYAIGFVRAYARHLGFDSEKVLARFRAESSALQARPDLSLPMPLGERSLPGTAVLVVALILALCGYGSWYYLSTAEHSRPERVAEVPAGLRDAVPDTGADRLPPSVPAPAPAATAVTTDPATSVPAPSPLPTTATAGTPKSAAGPGAPKMMSGLFGQQDAQTASAGGTPTTPAPAPMAAVTPGPLTADASAATPPAAEAPKAQPVSAGTSAAPASRIAIKATSDCWIQVRGPDQEIVFSRVLKQGETYQVPGKPGLALRTGNAGALQIIVDGKPAPSIGALGTLRRNVALDPDALLDGTAVHG